MILCNKSSDGYIFLVIDCLNGITEVDLARMFFFFKLNVIGSDFYWIVSLLFVSIGGNLKLSSFLGVDPFSSC